jgi:hypothetical protein
MVEVRSSDNVDDHCGLPTNGGQPLVCLFPSLLRKKKNQGKDSSDFFIRENANPCWPTEATSDRGDRQATHKS